MKRIVFALLLVAPPAFAAEFGWKCGDGSIRIAHVKPCQDGVTLAVEDMNAAELTAYTKAFREKERKDELARKAAETRRKVEDDLKNADEYRVCALFTNGPVIGMTEAQFVKCTWFGRPDTKNYTTTSYGTEVQYVYKSAAKTKYAYFRNGRLTAVQY